MKMQGKSSKKRKVGKIILLGMSFLLTIVMTFTITLAWFYDSDWASSNVTMAGTVGIEIRRKALADDDSELDRITTGSGNLYFEIATDYAYPGQAIDASASVYNNGGRSVSTGTSAGSACYVRAHFSVYTNIGMDDPTTPDIDEEELESEMNAQSLYDFLLGLIEAQNKSSSSYYWQYYQKTGSSPISMTGTSDQDIKHYLEGTQYDTAQTTAKDKGYFYLCFKEGSHTLKEGETPITISKDEAATGILMPLNVSKEAVFLWNSTFIIPWTLTNYSADKLIYVVVTFQAVQTFIPEISTTGIISGAANNQLPMKECTFDSTSVQTVFNSCNFKSTAEEEDAIKEVFGEDNYENISTPESA